MSRSASHAAAFWVAMIKSLGSPSYFLLGDFSTVCWIHCVLSLQSHFGLSTYPHIYAQVLHSVLVWSYSVEICAYFPWEVHSKRGVMYVAILQGHILLEFFLSTIIFKGPLFVVLTPRLRRLFWWKIYVIFVRRFVVRRRVSACATFLLILLIFLLVHCNFVFVCGRFYIS